MPFVFQSTPCSRSHVSSAMPKCANGHPRTLPLRPLLQRPLARRQDSHYASCVLTRLRTWVPAIALETSKRKATTGRGDGSARRVDHRVNVTLKVTTAAMAPEAQGASSSVTSDVRPQPDAAPPREATGTLAKSRTSHQYRQSKNFI